MRFVLRTSALLPFLGSVFSQSRDPWPRDVASATQGPDRYNYTLELQFDVEKFFYQERYQVNISLGTPPQNVPLVLDLLESDVIINRRTRYLDEDGRRTVGAYYGYNPDLSSSYREGDLPKILRNSTPIVYDPKRPLGELFRTPIELNYTYAQDFNCTIGSVKLSNAIGLGFRAHENATYIPNAPGSPPSTKSIDESFYLWHTAGFGLGEYPFGEFPGRNTTRSPSRTRLLTGLLADLRYGVGVIRSSTYSIWLDAIEKRTGHFLIGGLDESAYLAPLLDLKTFTVNYSMPLRETAVLAVNTSLVSITREGQSSIDLDFPVMKTILGSEEVLTLPNALAKRLFDTLGANLSFPTALDDVENMTDEYRLSLSTGFVPCSYLTNTTTLDFRFEGTNMTVAVPMSDLTRTYRGTFMKETRCYLLISALPDNDRPAMIGEALLKKLYRVYDLENTVIWVASTNFNASSNRIIKPIPSEGGVAAMNLSTAVDSSVATNSSRPPSSNAVGIGADARGVASLASLVVLGALAVTL